MGIFDVAKGATNTLLRTVTVEESGGIITLYGIDGKELLQGMFKVWRSSKIGQNMFTKVTGKSISFHRFFLIDVVYTFQSLIDQPRVRINRRALFKALEALKTSTSLNFVFDETYKPKDILDFKQLDQFHFKPLPQQQEYLERFNSIVPRYGLKGHLAALDIGLGKSLLSLYISKCAKVDTTFIICPGNAVVDPWRKTLDTAFKTPNTHWDSHSKEPLVTGKQYYVFHNDALDKLLEFIKSNRNAFGKVQIIIDESHNYNEIKSQRTELLCEIVKVLNPEITLWMSGTPIKAFGKECVPLLRTIDPLFDASTEKAFLNCFGVATDRALDIVSNRLGIITYTIRKESNAIGGKLHEHTVHVSIPNGNDYKMSAVRDKLFTFVKQRSEYYKKNRSQYVDQYMLGLELFEKSTSHSKNKKQYEQYKHYINVIRKGYDPKEHSEISQFCNAFERQVIEPVLMNPTKNEFRKAKSVYKYPDLVVMGEALGQVFGKIRTQCNVDIAKSLSKMQVYPATVDGVTPKGMSTEMSIQEIINDSSKKTICFTDYVEVIHALSDELKKDGYNPVAVYGETNKDLPKIIKTYREDEDVNPLLATFKSLSTATPLTMANTVIMLNSPYRELHYKQALGRAYRIGQDTDVHVYKVTLFTDGEPNISTRSEEILETMKKQVAVMMGLSELNLANQSLESFQTEFGLHIDGQEISMEWDIVNNPLVKFARLVKSGIHLAITDDEYKLNGTAVKFSTHNADSRATMLKFSLNKIKSNPPTEPIKAHKLNLVFDGKVLKTPSDIENAVKDAEKTLEKFLKDIPALDKALEKAVKENDNLVEVAWKTLGDDLLLNLMLKPNGEFPETIDPPKNADRIVNSVNRSIGWHLARIAKQLGDIDKRSPEYRKVIGSLQVLVDAYYRFFVAVSYYIFRAAETMNPSHESYVTLSLEEQAEELDKEDNGEVEDSDLETEFDEDEESEENEEEGEDTESDVSSEETTEDTTTEDESAEEKPEERPIRVPRVRPARILRYDPSGQEEDQKEQAEDNAPERQTEEPEVEVEETTPPSNEEEEIIEDEGNEEVVEEVEKEAQNVHEMAEEAMSKLARSSTEMDERTVKLETVEAIARKFQQHGVSQPDVIQLGQVSGRGERLFDERGVALESFTMRPSRTNYTISYEGAKKIMFTMIGAIVYYAFKAIYLIFKLIANLLYGIAKLIDWISRKISGEDNTPDLMDKVIVAIKQNTTLNDEYEKRLRENEDIAHRLDMFSEKWTKLLDRTLIEDSDEMKQVFKVFESLTDIETQVTNQYNEAVRIAKNARSHLSSGQEFKKFIEKSLSDNISDGDVEKIEERNDLTESVYENLKSLANEKMIIGVKEVEQLISKHKEHKVVMEKLIRFKFKESVITDPRTLKTIDDCRKQLDSIFEKEIDGLEADEVKELRQKTNNMFRIFRMNASTYLKLISLFALIGRQWSEFIRHRDGFIRRISAIARSIVDDTDETDTSRVLKTLLDDMKKK